MFKTTTITALTALTLSATAHAGSGIALDSIIVSGDQVLVQLCTEFDVPGLYGFLAETVSATLILLTEQLLDRADAESRGFALEDGKLPGVPSCPVARIAQGGGGR